MLTTPHVLVGLALLAKLPPILALPAALMSHFVFDFLLPHWNPHLYTEMKTQGRLSRNSLLIILIDGLVALGLAVFFALKSANFLPLIVAFLAVLPDLVEIPFYFLKYQPKWLSRYVTFEHNHQAKADIFWGSITQLIVIIACLKLLLA